MSALPGNPFLSVLHSTPMDAVSISLNATLALAFEQRTANLIAYLTTNSAALTEGIDVDIRARLGMDPATVAPPADQRCGKPLMDGRNEIRCWLKAHHEEECR